ncbi:MAG: M48 family metallopeptidase [Candidatus Kapaibacteriales bacterium]
MQILNGKLPGRNSSSKIKYFQSFKWQHSLSIIFCLNFTLLTFLISISLLFVSCEDGINIFTVEDEVQLGNNLHQQITNNPKDYPILNNTQAKNYIQSIVDEILLSPLIKYRNKFAYQVTIIRDDKTVNAFATPGGYIYVYTGLLKFLDNEATLAGVLAHEIAHAERRHSTQRITKAYGISFLLDIVLGKNPSNIEKIVSNLFVGLALLKNSREDEYEADSYSYEYLKSTGWYPGALIYFFDKVKSNEGSSFLEVLLSTHPLSQDRIAKLNEKIKNENLPPPTESNLFQKRYSEFKKTLP